MKKEIKKFKNLELRDILTKYNITLTRDELAQIFSLEENSFVNSSARERYELATYLIIKLIIKRVR